MKIKTQKNKVSDIQKRKKSNLLLLPTASKFKEMKFQLEKLGFSVCRMIWCAVYGVGIV